MKCKRKFSDNITTIFWAGLLRGQFYHRKQRVFLPSHNQFIIYFIQKGIFLKRIQTGATETAKNSLQNITPSADLQKHRNPVFLVLSSGGPSLFCVCRHRESAARRKFNPPVWFRSTELRKRGRAYALCLSCARNSNARFPQNGILDRECTRGLLVIIIENKIITAKSSFSKGFRLFPRGGTYRNHIVSKRQLDMLKRFSNGTYKRNHQRKSLRRRLVSLWDISEKSLGNHYGIQKSGFNQFTSGLPTVFVSRTWIYLCE